uniref:CSON012156 protein n=1 Tax=Culicoides sonorensis TaxID=179676 RepID=A0A336M4U9_CULSO
MKHVCGAAKLLATKCNSYISLVCNVDTIKKRSSLIIFYAFNYLNGSSNHANYEHLTVVYKEFHGIYMKLKTNNNNFIMYFVIVIKLYDIIINNGFQESTTPNLKGKGQIYFSY